MERGRLFLQGRDPGAKCAFCVSASSACMNRHAGCILKKNTTSR
ncbi:hypothetical protein HMPREF3213_02668 [Heyndrickxia coagulans]|uniref:Uncharacterized protein n=1 Tax=Heyndrickxia coagulans TaxID=1398 RepID=A0A133KJC9_HEYCO|nr:hypothetical protein HMPREF3213_02668 [Heyndrickxia coagulans]